MDYIQYKAFDACGSVSIEMVLTRGLQGNVAGQNFVQTGLLTQLRIRSEMAEMANRSRVNRAVPAVPVD